MIADARYNRGKVYKIVSPSTNLVYIGSTIQPLSKRFDKHRSAYKLALNGCNTHKTTAFQILKFGDAKIYLIEYYNCTSKSELEKYERMHIESMDCVNKMHPGRTKSEYYQDNKESMTKKHNEYYQKNKDALIVKERLNYQNNKDERCRKQREYTKLNRDVLNKKQRDRAKVKVTCDICNTSINKYNLKKHQKTQKCKSYICIFSDE